MDKRKSKQYIGNIYVWLYKADNLMCFGINGTNQHLKLKGYKQYSSAELVDYINEKLA